jgi:transcription elongation factor/antiterminator RfaH
MDKRFWRCIYCKPRSAHIAEFHLKNAGFETFLPLYRKKVRKNNKTIEEIKELFPNYLFVKFSLLEYRLIQYTRGVKKVLLGSEGFPAIIDECVIESIKERCTDGYVKLESNIKSGDKVLIKDGPFEGFEAVFLEETKVEERINILLKTVTGELKIEIAKSAVDKI